MRREDRTVVTWNPYDVVAALRAMASRLHDVDPDWKLYADQRRRAPADYTALANAIKTWRYHEGRHPVLRRRKKFHAGSNPPE